MKSLHPYWFLQSPVDMEHKYYVLMDFLQSVESDLDQKNTQIKYKRLTGFIMILRAFKSSKN